MILPMENTERMIFPGVGKYGIPEIRPETDIRIDKLEWIPVNYALTAKDKATKGVHFYKGRSPLWGNFPSTTQASRKICKASSHPCFAASFFLLRSSAHHICSASVPPLDLYHSV